jgi:hypothetical protein
VRIAALAVDVRNAAWFTFRSDIVTSKHRTSLSRTVVWTYLFSSQWRVALFTDE